MGNFQQPFLFMKVSLIYLAAGNGQRFKESVFISRKKDKNIENIENYQKKEQNIEENKLLFFIKDEPMYLHLLKKLVSICERHSFQEAFFLNERDTFGENFLENENDTFGKTFSSSKNFSWKVIVVTQYKEIIDGAKKLGVKTVFSPDSKKGASFSIKAGILAAEEQEADVCVFFVADQPFLKEETVEAFLNDMVKHCKSGLGCVKCGEELGNPVWFSKKFFKELLQLSADQGGKKVLKAHIDKARFFPVIDKNELRDIDVFCE